MGCQDSYPWRKEAPMSMAETQETAIGSAQGAQDYRVFLEQAREAFGTLEAWVVREALELPEDEVERGIEARGREAHRLLLQAHLKRRESGRVGRALEVTEGEQTYRAGAGRVGARQIGSIFGTVGVARTAYGAQGKRSVHPLDEELRLPARSFSYELQRRVAEESVRGAFDEAVESTRKRMGVSVPKRSAEQIVEDAAEDFDAFYERRRAPEAEETGPVLVAAVDGKGVPLVKPERALRATRRTKGQKANKKKMATVAAVYTLRPRIRTPEEVVESLFEEERAEPAGPRPPRCRPEHKRVWARLAQGREEMLQDVAAEVRARDPQGEKKQVAVTDGERGLQARVRMYLPNLLLILDLLHVLEKLWQVAHALYGEGTEAAREGVRAHARMILKGRCVQVVKGIRQSVTKRRLKGAKRQTLLSVAKYLYRNRERMRYDEYLREGFPIASGAVEGACKNLVKDRMERSGMRWKIPGAEAMLKLRALTLSGDFEAYWRFHMEEDQKRLHGSRTWRVAA